MRWAVLFAGMLMFLSCSAYTASARAGEPADHGRPVPMHTLTWDGQADTTPIGWHGGHHGWYGDHGWHHGRWRAYAFGWRPWLWYARSWWPGYVAWGGPGCVVTPPLAYGAPPCGLATAIVNLVGTILANRPLAHEVVIEQTPVQSTLPPPTPVVPPSASPPPIPPEEVYPNSARPAEVAPMPQPVAAKPANKPSLRERLAARRAAGQLRRQLRHAPHEDVKPPPPPEPAPVAVSVRREPKP